MEKEIDIKFNMIDYLEWLREYTNNHSKASSISIDTKDNAQAYLNKIFKFFEIIDTYAKNNYLVGDIANENVRYCIKDKDIFYEVGCLYFYDFIYYVKRISPQEQFISIEDIIKNKKSDKTIKFDNMLMTYCNYMNNMIKEGLPLEIIEKTTSQVLTKAKRKL